MTNAEFNRELAGTQSILFRFALKLTRDHQDAQDLFQDAATRAYRYSNRFELGTNFRAWMSTIIRNTFISNYQRNKKQQTVSEPLASFSYFIESKNIVSNKGEMDMRIKEIYGLLDEIDEIYRIPFLMHFQGYEYKDIAEKLSTPIGTIKSRLHTARLKLKQKLNREDKLFAQMG